ncbi:DUF5590 domain-containing protein [Terrihalobacillus insolitus]|uniref:cell wall elongation regulator TseB-like domain-containing protein n=1 Tax=Terrihalobacillus insolitus TaxID=2950438 RepID=UPI0023418478|nr:DUF5590 domain-containing protein [Terrihalobacillus insolitus]MDC3413022.1 DUF5590 domain-containing protein [Terrihalobacillus insolitus]
MEKRFLPFTVPSWLKWIIVCMLVVLVLIFSYGVFLYNSIQEDKTKGFTQSKQTALSETALTKVNDIQRFHGDGFYHVVSGSTKDNKEAIAFVPVDDEKDISFFLTEQFVTEDEITTKWRKTCSDCQLVKTIPGINKGIPLWEFTYIDNDNRYVFAYFYMETGKSYEKIRFKTVN